MKSISSSRRRFLKTSSLATAFALARNPFPLAFAREKVSGADLVILGVASYSLRKLPRADAIAAVNALGTPYVNIKSIHLPYELPADQLTAGRREFEAAGLTIVGGGTVSLQKDTDKDIQGYFEYARRSGMPLMVIAPTTQTLPRI